MPMAFHPTGSPIPPYRPPRGNVFLLTCMDLRLLDQIVRFMAHDNLTNRYDHVIIAGAALGASGHAHADDSHWRRTFFDHLEIAHNLHDFHDVYILEHRNCGAYAAFLGPEGTFGETDEEHAREAEAHRKYATALKDDIDAWARERKLALRVLRFLMGLRGEVELLDDPESPVTPRRVRKPAGRSAPGSRRRS
jgi:hypothetical protein